MVPPLPCGPGPLLGILPLLPALRWDAGSYPAPHCACKCESPKSLWGNCAVPDWMLIAVIGAARQEQDESSDPLYV